MDRGGHAILTRGQQSGAEDGDNNGKGYTGAPGLFQGSSGITPKGVVVNARVTGIGRGDPVTLEFSRQRERMVRTLARITGCVATAEDLAQEAYLRVHDSVGRRPITHVRAFLFQTGRNLAIDHIRARARGDRVREIVAADGIQAGETEFGITAPEARADQLLTLRRLEKVLRRMPVRRRRIFVLHRLHGVGQKEIAARLGVSLSTVEKELRKAVTSCLREVSG